MADMDSARTGGEPVLPNTDNLQGGDQHNYIDTKTFDAAIQRLERMEKMFGSVQSSKDKGINQLNERLGELDQRLARYEQLRSSGLSPTDATRQMEIDDLLAERKQGRNLSDQVAEVDGDGNPPARPSVAVDTVQLLQVLGLSDTDPDVMALVRNGVTDANKYVTLAIGKKAAQAATPNPAAITPAGGGSPADTESLESVTAELQAEMGKKVLDLKRIRDLQQKQAALLPRK